MHAKMRKAHKIFLENLKRRGHMGRLRQKGRIVSKWILEK
jgi:hypothetical protein